MFHPMWWSQFLSNNYTGISVNGLLKITVHVNKVMCKWKGHHKGQDQTSAEQDKPLTTLNAVNQYE